MAAILDGPFKGPSRIKSPSRIAAIFLLNTPHPHTALRC